MKRTGYDYIPSPGEDYYPQGKPVDPVAGAKILASGTDSNLVQQTDGTIVLTDKKGRRRGA